MTASYDLERALAAFLDEGPVRSPDRPVEAALVHARAHPRRRDPLRALRRDPMARPGPWIARPALALGLLALLLALSAAVYVGSRPSLPTIVPPLPTASPSLAPASPPPSGSPAAPSASAEPSASASPSARPSPTPPTSVDVVDAAGTTATVELVDRSGELTTALGWPAEPDRPQNAEIEVVQLPADEGAGEDAVILMWVEVSCPGPHTLTIDEDVTRLVLETLPCDGDAIGVDHQLLLEFARPVTATELEVELVRLPRP